MNNNNTPSPWILCAHYQSLDTESKSMARIRDDWERLIELFAEVSLPRDTTEPFILRKYPQDYSNKEILNSVPYFSYPCPFKCDVITHFSFVLTNLNSKWTFGYCRHTPNSETCLVLLSDLPWHSTFYRILDHCAVLLTRQSSLPLERFIEALYTSDLPQPGLQLNVTYTVEEIRLEQFSSPCPDHQKLPCIPEDRNITEYFNAISPANMIAIFASMLHERRIVITSGKLNRLSACVQAANALIYPMHWQHIFIPLLPSHLIDYLSAPMPFLIGVPQTTLTKIKSNELGDIVLLNADTNQLTSPFDDVSTLPSDVLHNLRKSLKQSTAAFGDGLCRAFMRALVLLIGGYHEALRIVPGEKIRFDRDAFVTNVRGTSRQLFLEKILQLQIFQQFIESRLDMLNSGEGFVDQFEMELSLLDTNSHSRFKAQYKEWMAAIRKEGGALLRAVNPKVKSAISKSRQAVRNLRAIIATPSNGVDGGYRGPSSEPSSPKLPPKIKKSISGTAISQTSRTVTYVRTPPGVSTSASGHHRHGGKQPNKRSSSQSASKSRSQFHVSTNNYNGIAPAASSESSDIDDNEHRLTMNITDELEDIFRNKASKFNGSSCSSNFIPIPPPRSEKSRTTFNRPPMTPAKSDRCLIEFDSPPRESPIVDGTQLSGALVTTHLFDPLFEAGHTGNHLENNGGHNFEPFRPETIIPKLEMLSVKPNSQTIDQPAPPPPPQNPFRQKHAWQKFD